MLRKEKGVYFKPCYDEGDYPIEIDVYDIAENYETMDRLFDTIHTLISQFYTPLKNRVLNMPLVRDCDPSDLDFIEPFNMARDDNLGDMNFDSEFKDAYFDDLFT